MVETDASATAIGDVLAQKQDDGKVRPIQFASRTMNAAEKNYSACEREALAVIFALRKFRIYLLSTEPFKLITDHKALRDDFKKNIHGRLAPWMDFLVEYEFEVVYRAGEKNKVANFLSRHSLDSLGGGDEGEMALTTGDDDGLFADLEPKIQKVGRYLLEVPMGVGDSRERKSIKRSAKSFVVCEQRIFRRAAGRLRVVVPTGERVVILKNLHGELGHWDRIATMKVVTDRFWWPSVRQDVERYVKTCNACQYMKPVPRYVTSLSRPVMGLFDVFPIDFAGPFPRPCEGGLRYLLLCVEHPT